MCYLDRYILHDTAINKVAANKLIKELGLTNKMNISLNCYLLAPRRYIIFCDGNISKSNINEGLKEIDSKCNIDNFGT